MAADELNTTVNDAAATRGSLGTAGKATVVDAGGRAVETRDLEAARFAVPANVNTLHLVVRAEQAARRRGTHSTKTRGTVSGSTAKLFRQKGTGRARAGSIKSPLRPGGGIVFGPHPRSYDIKVNRKVVRQSLAMALSNRAENGRIFVAADLNLEVPSTKTMNDFLVKLDIVAPVLVVTLDEPTVTKSVRNLAYAQAAEVGALTTEQVLRARSLVLTEKAFAALNQA
jgi:large subunit ribosomal protein L4